MCDHFEIFLEVKGEVIWSRTKGLEEFETFEKAAVAGRTRGILGNGLMRMRVQRLLESLV